MASVPGCGSEFGRGRALLSGARAHQVCQGVERPARPHKRVGFNASNAALKRRHDVVEVGLHLGHPFGPMGSPRFISMCKAGDAGVEALGPLDALGIPHNELHASASDVHGQARLVHALREVQGNAFLDEPGLVLP